MEGKRMRKKVLVWMMAAAATLSLAMPVSATVSAKTANTGRYRYVDANGDGVCDYFTDKDGDGICDNCDWGGRPGAGCGRYFTDKDGDGICDHYAVRQTGRGRRGGQGRGRF